MKVAYFDCTFGAAGDMLLGALVSAGLPVDPWLAELAKIALPEGSFKVEITDVVRCTIAAKKVDVHCLPQERTRDRLSDNGSDTDKVSSAVGNLHTHGESHSHTHGESQSHSHAESHSHSHGESHSHAHSESHAHAHSESPDRSEPERGLSDILTIIEKSSITARAKQLASDIFKRLAEAEAAAHGVTLDAVHFHEVGAIDAVVDIIGFAIAYDLLGVEHSIVSPLPVGSGTIKTRHGLFPVPGPAVVNLLSRSGIPVASSTFAHECLTPTGAAILSTVCASWGSMPTMKISSTGYGAGTFNPQGFPNVSRIVIGDAVCVPSSRVASALVREADDSSSFESEVIAVLETNLDDLSPQLLSFVMEQLLQSGALDVSVTPIVMKKSRSGHLLCVLCKPADRVVMEELILRQTTSLGVRSYLCERLVAQREWKEVTIGDGHIVRVKLAKDRSGKVVNAQPEYEDCADYATKNGVPLKVVLSQVIANLERDS